MRRGRSSQVDEPTGVNVEDEGEAEWEREIGAESSSDGGEPGHGEVMRRTTLTGSHPYQDPVRARSRPGYR